MADPDPGCESDVFELAPCPREQAEDAARLARELGERAARAEARADALSAQAALLRQAARDAVELAAAWQALHRQAEEALGRAAAEIARAAGRG